MELWKASAAAVFAAASLTALSAAASAGGGPPSFTARAYFMEARRLYRTAEYAAGTNSLIHKYSREDPFGFDGRYDLPDMQRKHIPDEPIFWKMPGLRNVRDIGGWTGLKTGVVYRGSQLYRVEGAPDGIDQETRRIVREEWNLATDFDLRGVKSWAMGKGASTNLAELTGIGVRKQSHEISAYERIFDKPEVVGAALKDLAKPETYPTYIHCAGGADRTGTLVFILEALCGVPEADIDIDYELTSFATVFGVRDRNVTGEKVSFKRLKDKFKSYPGATLQEQVENACLTTFGLTKDEISSIRRILVPETEWLYSLADQTTGVQGAPDAVLHLKKGWNKVKRGTVPAAIGGPDRGKPLAKIFRQPTPPPFPDEPRRPYEIEQMGRKADEHPSLFTLESADGWSVEAENAEARFFTTDERCLFGETSARLEYRADFARGTNAVVRLRPPAPVSVAGEFDAISFWMYGNRYPYDTAPGASNFKIRAEFENSKGERRLIDAAENWCAYWFQYRYNLNAEEKAFASDGAKFLGFAIEGFANEASALSLDFGNFCVFRDNPSTPDIPRRPKRPVRLFADQDQGMNTDEGTLPFPTTPDTVVPPVAVQNPDLEFRFPAKPDESWDDLAFRYRGGEWIRMAIGGGVLPRGAGRGGRFEFRRVGDSVVCDMKVDGGKATDVVFGDFEYEKLPKARKVPVPYYHATVPFKLTKTIQKVFDLPKRPGLLVTEFGGEPFFIAATFDWTQSAGSWPYCESDKAPFGGVAYFARTDGTRSDVCERFVWSFSLNPVDALANIPNPKSPYKHLSGKRAFAFARSYDLHLTPDINPQENETRERIWDYWRRVRRLGIKDLNVNGHEKMWRDYMDSFTFKTNTAPLKGGDAAALRLANGLKSLGFHVGPYNNFTDFAPVNENWNPDFVARQCDEQAGLMNQFYHAWTRTYLPKPVYSVHAMETLLPVVQAKFGFQNVYSDVHTAYSPWFRIDYDARMPGAGTLTSSFYAYGELLQKQKSIWNGPVCSEGWGHVIYAGLSDGDFARDDDYFSGALSSDPSKPWDHPWIVDYDLVRIHPLNCCAGTMARNFWGRRAPADRDLYADRHLCHVLGFGHAVIFHNGFFRRDNSLAIDDIMELREYYMPLALAGRYTQADAAEIRYGDGKGGLLDTAHAIASGTVGLNHVKVTYSDGTVVAVNGGKGTFALDWFGERLLLDPNCYAGRSGDDVKVFSGFIDGHHADLSVAPDYVYIDGRGKFVSFDEGASDGLLLRLKYTSVVDNPLADGEEDVLLLRGATIAELPYAATKVVAMDLEGRPFKTLEPEIRNGRTVLRPIDGAASFRVSSSRGNCGIERLCAEMARGLDASGASAIPEGAKPWLENRISRCFFGPIKRPPFNRDELMDDVDYYPDAYLAQLRDEGVNGLWLTIEFRDLVETSFNRRHPTAARRLDKLRRTVEKCARYGIGVWVFAIEPSCGNVSPEFYAENKALFEKAYWPPADDWDHLMCPSKPEARRYLKEALKDLFAQVPGLKGFINICHGERWTTCLSQFASSAVSTPRPQLCPACSKRQPWEVLNDILVPMRDGIKTANPDARLVCWFYMAEPCAERSEWVYDCARHVPEGVSFQMNFESGIVCAQEGRPRVGGDYWLSQPGPSDIFRRAAEACREAGSRLAAKIQVSVSHEMATVPHVPVPGLLYRKFKAMHDCGVKDAMYCWYFGCSPGLMNRAAGMLSCEDFSGGEDAFLDRLAQVEWGEDAPRVAGLWKTFASAYGNYPVSNMMQYYGPFHDGVAWELHPLLDLKPLSRSWKCDRADGDTIGECLEGFSLDEARRLADAMCAPLDGCIGELDALAAKYADDVRRSREIGVMKAFVVLCRSGRDVLAFYQARRDAVRASRVRHDSAEALRHVAEMRRLAESARNHSAMMIPLCEMDSRLGFHPEAETYKFNPEILRRRIGDIDRVMCELDGIERELAAGRPYPESGFERSAPVWNAVRREDGRVVVDGNAVTGRTDGVRIDLYEETGSEYPTQIVAKVEGGRFNAALPEGDWGWIHVSRPGLPDMPAVGESVPGRLKLGRSAVRNCARLVVLADETAKWQSAIDSAAAGGGVVNVPAGEHMVGGLELRSNVELHLEKGATLLAAVGLNHYRIVKYPYSEGDWSAIVMGLNITNAAITGEGVIHGRGGKWPAPTKEDYRRGHQESLRARGMFFYQSKGIRLEDFTLKDAACWGIVLKECDGVVARKVTIDSHANHNNDGFDIESKNVLIEDCVADSGDDPFVIKSSNPDFVCENIMVRRCMARGQGNAFKIGTATRGIVRNVRFENVRCEDATRVCTKLDDGTPTKLLAYHNRCKIGGRTPHGCMLNAVCFACVDGGCVENITVDGLDIAGGVLMPFYVRSDFRKKGMESGAVAPGKWNKLRNIRISNVRGRAMGPVASAIMGTEGFHVENVVLKDIDIEIEGAGEEASRAALETPVPPPNSHYPSGDQFYPHIFPAYGLYADRVDGLTMENVRFRLAPGTDDVRPPVRR